ncbi:MAG TPA: LLM class flavin-dependent oxidoreductase [Acidimicrobiales bacterium]|nr:LLM class flavin-dependent oxidoreductase [Acidimicrobiales bacterium]
MRTGLLLPIFQDDARRALDAARRAEDAGVDGVFCYDHVWPMGQPGRPALAPFPVLSLVATRTERVAVGPLVARVGLVPDRVLLGQFAALRAIAPGRVIAAMGTGDRLSAGENEAYGVEFEVAARRRARLARCVRSALDMGLVTWVGDGSASTRRIAADEGAALNLWDATVADVRDEARRAEVTWAGPVTGPLAPAVGRLAGAGATWAVFAWPVDVDELAAAGRAASSGGA